MQNITVRRTAQGGIELSAIVNDERIARTYFFYTLKEAKKNFKDYIRGLQ